MVTAQVTATHDALARGIGTALDRGDLGVQVAVWGPDGVIAEGWGGTTDTKSGTAVGVDSLFPVFSVTKGVTAAAMHVQIDRGLISLDDLVIDHWPEYGQAGKEATTVLDVLTHRAGLSEMPDDATPERTADWGWMVERFAGMAPAHRPGTNAYHSTTWGWLVGELVRRTDPTHRPFCAFVQEELLDRIGVTDCWMVLPPELDARMATLSGQVFWPGRPVEELVEGTRGPEQFRACRPSGGIVSTARGIARFYAMLANGGELDGVRVVQEERLRDALDPRPEALVDDVTAGRVRLIGRGGWWLGGNRPGVEPIASSGTRVLWHPGMGGSIGLADLDRRIAVAICHNRVFAWENIPRDVHPFGAIMDAVYDITA